MNPREPNPRTSTRPIAIALAAALLLTLAACGGGGGGGGADTGTLAVTVIGSYTIAAEPVSALPPALNGTTYDPVVPSQGGAGDTRNITVPADPGGGSVTVSLKANAGIRPLLGVQVLPLVGGSIFTEATEPARNLAPPLLEMVFEVAPGRSYQLTLRAAAAAGGVTFPQSYTANWSFTSRVDCYEPNDTLATAKAIPMENPILASFITGYRDSNSIPALSVPTLDFYRFELHAPTTVRITLSDVVDTVRPRLVLDNAADAAVGS
jgi:hypothetical protein